MENGTKKLQLKLNRELEYRRENNVVYQEDRPLLKVTDCMLPDFNPLSEKGLEYHEKFYNMFPEKVEVYDQELLFEVEIKVRKQKNVVIRDLNLFDQTLKVGSRKEQVSELLTQGTTSPKVIADILGTNASYVQRLIKEIQQ